MKRNAILRIIIWSLVLVLLVGILAAGLTFGSYQNLRRSSKPAETMIPMPITESIETPAPTEADSSSGGNKDYFSPQEITEIEIEWVAGDILIQAADTDRITVKEDHSGDPKYNMVLKKKGSELDIQFCEEGVASYFGINTRSDVEKDLTITVPKDWICESLDIECALAKVEVNDLTIREVDFDGASGSCEFENCTVEEIDIDTASGDVRFIGSLNMLDCDAASASVYAVLSNTPSRLDMDTMSGNLDITLPEGAGFALTMDSAARNFESDFETVLKNGSYVSGDGSCRINVDALSGNVAIRKGEAVTP